MSNNQFNLAYATDLNEGLRVVPIQPVFISGDDQAHCFIISANRNGKEEKLTGATVRGYFIRPDNVTVTLEGSVNDAGQAVLSLNSSCYNKQGRFQIVIRAIMDDVASTIFCGDGGIRLSSTDSFIDEEGIVPSLDDLLAQIDAIEAAVNNANSAADRANTAAEKAENAKGDTGATPNLTIGTVETLAAGSNATATITGTAEDPVLSFGIPKGYDGDGAVLSVNGKTGEVELTANDVSAVPAVAEYYSPNTGMRMSADDLVVPFALIPLNSEVNVELYEIMGDTFAWVRTSFHKEASTTTRRMQVATSYNSINQKMAFRTYTASGWLPWEEIGIASNMTTGAVSSVNGKTGVVELTAEDVGAAPAIEDPSHPGCYYRMVDGVKEWINPPMEAGVEYRTTERFNDDPVHRKYIIAGWLDAGAQTIEHQTNVAFPIECQVINNNSENLTNDASTNSLYFGQTVVNFDSIYAHGGISLILRYTKL